MSPKGKEVVVESEPQAALEVKSSEGKKVMVESEFEADLEVRSSKGKEVVVESEAELEVMFSKDKEVAVESEAKLEMKPLKGKEVVVESEADLEVRSSKGKEVVVESEAELEVMPSKGKEVAVESEAELEVKSSKGKEVVVEFEDKSEEISSKSKRKNKRKGKGKVVDYQAAADSTPKKFVVLRSSDKVEFEVEESLAQRSDMLKDMIEDVAISDGIPLPNITGPVLTKVIEYWKHHAEGVEGSEEMKKWDADFAHCDGNFNKRYDLILAANYLAAKPLLDLLLQAVADAIKDMKVEDMREYLSIENDFTEEEEKAYKDEYAWAFEI